MTQNAYHSNEKRSAGQMLLNILKFVGFVIIALIPMQIIVMLILAQDEFSTTTNSVLSIVCFLLIVGIIWFLWNRYSKYSKEKALKLGLRDIGFALLFFLLARVVAMVGTLLITWIYGEEMTANDEAIMSITDSSRTFVLYFLLFVLAMGLLVPVVEELAYRGIATHLLFKQTSFWLPLIVTSTIFGLMHTPTNIISFLLYAFIGVILFLAYFRRKNIVDSMLVHILNNGVSAIYLLITYLVEVL